MVPQGHKLPITKTNLEFHSVRILTVLFLSWALLQHMKFSLLAMKNEKYPWRQQCTVAAKELSKVFKE